MGKHIRLRDPETGRSIIVYEESLQDYMVPRGEYPVPARRERSYRPRRNHRWSRERRERKAGTWTVGVVWFVGAFCMAGTHPGMTILLWGCLLAWLLRRSFTD